MNEFEWYQCNIVTKDGKEDFWCRFIAKSEHDAKERIQKKLKYALTGTLKNLWYQLLEKRYVKDYHIFRVPESTLQKYNFMKAGETDLFYEQARG